jgi:initiation factor 1A
MVKNTSGGKHSKKAKRGLPPLQAKTRVIEEEGELYACVKRVLGNGRLEVMCIDNVVRQCHIPKKFRHFSRDNVIRVGGWLMVGIRLFESNKNNCDVLEVYSPYDIDYLKKLDENWVVFGEEECSLIGIDEIEFTEQPLTHGSSAAAIDFDDI